MSALAGTTILKLGLACCKALCQCVLQTLCFKTKWHVWNALCQCLLETLCCETKWHVWKASCQCLLQTLCYSLVGICCAGAVLLACAAAAVEGAVAHQAGRAPDGSHSQHWGLGGQRSRGAGPLQWPQSAHGHQHRYCMPFASKTPHANGLQLAACKLCRIASNQMRESSVRHRWGACPSAVNAGEHSHTSHVAKERSQSFWSCVMVTHAHCDVVSL